MYEKYIINNVKLDEVDKMISDSISTHNRKFDVYFVNCEFKTEFDSNFRIKIKTKYIPNIESKKIIESFIFYYIDCLKLKGYKF